MINRKFIVPLLSVMACISCTKINGSITSEGDALGRWSLIPEKCMTGDRERTVGATLYTEKDPALSVKIVKTVNAVIMIAVTIPSTCGNDGLCKAVILDPSMCSQYSADVTLTNVMTPDDYRQADGHLSLNCIVSVGLKKSRLRGDVLFKNCN